MDILVAFLFFIASVALSLAAGANMLAPLGVGLLLFGALALRRGYTLPAVAHMAFRGLKESFIVVGVLLLIGCLTGLWRQCGTVAYLVSAGTKLMPPNLFLLAAFLLCAFMSFAIGTSFGVTATAGVIIMSIARAGGLPVIPVAGVILSGVYVGDRGSPASSAANLVAAVTSTDVRRNIREMLRTALVPFLLCLLAYGALSFRYPMQAVDSGVYAQLADEFSLSWLLILPALVMIVLPFLHVKVKWAMAVDIVLSFALAMALQGASATNCLKAMLLGYAPRNQDLSAILSGGGISSMLNTCGILLLSGTYGGIFRETGMLTGLNARLSEARGKIGRFPLMVLLSFALGAVFCNQTISVIMLSQLTSGLYEPDEKYQKMIDIENSVITIAGLVPWCIACSVPLAMVGADARAIPFALYLYLIPLWSLIHPRAIENTARKV